MKITGQLTVAGHTLDAMREQADIAIGDLLAGPGVWDTTIVLEGLRQQSAELGWIATAVFVAEVVPPLVVPELEPDEPTEPEMPTDPEVDPEAPAGDDPETDL